MDEKGRNNNYNSTKDTSQLSFSESWKQKSVELATTGAILAGAGTLAVKGDMGDSIRYGKQAMRQAGRGFENYVKRRSNPVTKLVYNTGKKTLNGISRKKPIDGEQLLKGDNSFNLDSIKDIDIEMESSRIQAEEENLRRYMINKAKQLNQELPRYEPIDSILIEEKVKQAFYEKSQRANRNATSANLDSDKSVLVEAGQKGNRNATFIGGAISGLGFGAGITALHAFDKATREERETKKDHSFEAAGSYLNRNGKNKGGSSLNKEAGIRQVHDGLAGLGSKVPQAAATGVGFTGVSLGTASMLKKQREQETDANKKNRIIIEFGEDELENKDDGGHAAIGRMGMVPRPGLTKSAGAGGYLKNLGGRKAELDLLGNRIKNHDYQSSAAESLKNKNVPELAKKKYGHLLPDDKAKEKLLEEQTRKLQNSDRDVVESIKDNVARDRMYTGAGVGLAGLGASGFSLLSKNKKEGASNE